jgi:hypothetical protein
MTLEMYDMGFMRRMLECAVSVWDVKDAEFWRKQIERELLDALPTPEGSNERP